MVLQFRMETSLSIPVAKGQAFGRNSGPFCSHPKKGKQDTMSCFRMVYVCVCYMWWNTAGITPLTRSSFAFQLDTVEVNVFPAVELFHAELMLLFFAWKANGFADVQKKHPPPKAAQEKECQRPYNTPKRADDTWHLGSGFSLGSTLCLSLTDAWPCRKCLQMQSHHPRHQRRHLQAGRCWNAKLIFKLPLRGNCCWKHRTDTHRHSSFSLFLNLSRVFLILSALEESGIFGKPDARVVNTRGAPGAVGVLRARKCWPSHPYRHPWYQTNIKRSQWNIDTYIE